MRKTNRAALVAGVPAGIAGLLVFLVVHALWILPIWFILPIGLPIAMLGGLAVGWAYGELRPRFPQHPWTILAVVLWIVATLLPSIAIAEIRAPLYVVTLQGAVLQVPIWVLVAHFVVELLVSATIVGGAIGWLLGRTRRATAAAALAGFVFALGPGHNIPFIGGTSGVGKELALMGAVIVVAAVVMVEVHAWLCRPNHDTTSLDNEQTISV